MIYKFLCALVCSIVICSFLDCLQCFAKTLTVTSSLDQPVPGYLTLREAIKQADSCIGFDPRLDSATIDITRPLDITREVTITTEGLRNGITVRGKIAKAPLFNINAPTSLVTLIGLTVSGGGPGIAVFPGTSLSMDSCSIERSDNAGILFSGNSLTMSRTTCHINGGEGVVCRATGQVSIFKSSFVDNATGGLTASAPKMTISYCRIDGNRGPNALDINGAQVNVNNSIVTGNNSFRTLSTAVCHSEGLAVFDRCTISENAGGGVSNFGGTMRLYRCSIIGNTFSRSRDPFPSAILNENATMFTEECTIANNSSVRGPTIAVVASATQSGAPSSRLTMRYCTIFGNTVTEPSSTTRSSGIEGETFSNYNSVDITVDHCTISGNTTAGRGGGISLLHSGGLGPRSVCVLNATTITDNRAATAGGVNVASTPLVEMEVSNSIIAGNKDDQELEPDFLGRAWSRGFNVLRNGAGSDGWNESDLVGDPSDPIDPRLERLADNGGPTLTHKPMADSPAVNSGDPAYAGMRDQKGEIRRLPTERGAVEAYGSSRPVPVPIKPNKF